MKYYYQVILGLCHQPWNQDFTECHRWQKRSGKILQLWSIFPGVWMVWVGPKKHGNWEITRKSETWRRLGESNTMLKCIWVVFVDEFWGFLSCQFANCLASGRAFLQWNRTCGRATQSHLWISKVARRWPTGFSWSPSGVELRDFPLAMIIIFMNEAPKKNPNHSAGGVCFKCFPKFHHEKNAEDEPQFWLSCFFQFGKSLAEGNFWEFHEIPKHGGSKPIITVSFKVKKRRLQLVFSGLVNSTQQGPPKKRNAIVGTWFIS